MQIIKKIKCIHCGDVLSFIENGNVECNCKKIVVVEGHIKGNVGLDYVDVSPKLLNE